MKQSGKRFLTVDYVYSRCGWSVRVRTQAPAKHALHYAQGIDVTDCFRCRQKNSLADCQCCKSEAT